MNTSINIIWYSQVGTNRVGDRNHLKKTKNIVIYSQWFIA